MCVGNARRLFYLFLRGISHSERDVGLERVVEEDAFLVHVADERAQVVHPQVADVDAVDENLALLHVVVTRYEVNECGFSAAALSYERHRLAFFYLQVDMPEHPLFAIAERHVAELDGVLEAVLQCFRLFGVLYFHFGEQNLVNAFHRCQTFRDVV